jgi:hypothetical protein
MGCEAREVSTNELNAVLRLVDGGVVLGEEEAAHVDVDGKDSREAKAKLNRVAAHA